MLTRILMVSLVVCALSYGQGKKGGGGGGGGGGMGGMGAAAMTPMDRWSQDLKLDKDEKKQIKSIMDDAQKEALPIKDQMEKGRLTIAQAVAGGKQDEIDSAVKTYASTETQMASIEMNAFAKVYNVLDKEQQQKSPEIYAAMPGIFKNKNWNQNPTQ